MSWRCFMVGYDRTHLQLNPTNSPQISPFISSSSYFSTMNSWISIPVCRAPPCNLSIISSPTLSEVTGIAVFCTSFSAANINYRSFITVRCCGRAKSKWVEKLRNEFQMVRVDLFWDKLRQLFLHFVPGCCRVFDHLHSSEARIFFTNISKKVH